MPEMIDFIESHDVIIPNMRISRDVYINGKLVVKEIEFGYARYTEKGTIDYKATCEGRITIDRGSITDMAKLFMKDDE